MSRIGSPLTQPALAFGPSRSHRRAPPASAAGHRGGTAPFAPSGLGQVQWSMISFPHPAHLHLDSGRSRGGGWAARFLRRPQAAPPAALAAAQGWDSGRGHVRLSTVARPSPGVCAPPGRERRRDRGRLRGAASSIPKPAAAEPPAPSPSPVLALDLTTITLHRFGVKAAEPGRGHKWTLGAEAL